MVYRKANRNRGHQQPARTGRPGWGCPLRGRLVNVSNKKNTKFVPATCKHCGGEMQRDPSNDMVTCMYCGTSYFVEKTIDNTGMQRAPINDVASVNVNVNIHERDAVESRLNSVENQQDRRQQESEAENRRKNNQQVILAFVALVFFCCVGCTVLGMLAPDQEDHTGEAKTPAGSIIQKGDDYQEVIKRFEEQGFTNIKTEKLDDLVMGWLTKEGEVEKVSVDGDEDYSPDVWYPADVEVLITYHTFPEKDDANEGESSDEVAKESQKEETPTPEQTDNSESATMAVIADDQPLFLTVENSEEFAEFISVKSEGDPLIQKFVSNNIGNTIVFEGNIAHMMPHGSSDTRYDILIYTGDYSETSASGPIFKFEDVNAFDLNLSGNNIPDTINMGLDIIVTARIVEFRDQIGITFLEPIKTEIR
jgi:predicted nucleic-acid-binding Zn-ribbon protein